MPRDGMMAELKDVSKFDESGATEISQETVKDVNAEFVRMHQADADTITAEKVELQQSAAGHVQATRVSAHQSAVATVDATEVLAEQAGLGYVQAETVSVSGYTGAIVATTADVHQSMAAVVVGNDVHVSESRTVLLIAKNVQGNVITLMDTRSAVIAGLLAGLFASVSVLLGRMLFGRK